MPWREDHLLPLVSFQASCTERPAMKCNGVGAEVYVYYIYMHDEDMQLCFVEGSS